MGVPVGGACAEGGERPSVVLKRWSWFASRSWVRTDMGVLVPYRAKISEHASDAEADFRCRVAREKKRHAGGEIMGAVRARGILSEALGSRERRGSTWGDCCRC